MLETLLSFHSFDEGVSFCNKFRVNCIESVKFLGCALFIGYKEKLNCSFSSIWHKIAVCAYSLYWAVRCRCFYLHAYPFQSHIEHGGCLSAVFFYFLFMSSRRSKVTAWQFWPTHGPSIVFRLNHFNLPDSAREKGRNRTCVRQITRKVMNLPISASWTIVTSLPRVVESPRCFDETCWWEMFAIKELPPRDILYN